MHVLKAAIIKNSEIPSQGSREKSTNDLLEFARHTERIGKKCNSDLEQVLPKSPGARKSTWTISNSALNYQRLKKEEQKEKLSQRKPTE